MKSNWQSFVKWVRENGVLNGFAGAVVAALIGLIVLLPRDDGPTAPTAELQPITESEPTQDQDTVSESVPSEDMEPFPDGVETRETTQPATQTATPSSVTYEVTMGTSSTTNRSGTDSDVQLQFFRGETSVATLVFYGGRGEDDILEQRLPLENSERFSDQRPLVADRVRITLVTPRGNGGHWYGTRFQVSSLEEKIDLCAVDEIGWLVDGASSVERRLEAC